MQILFSSLVITLREGIEGALAVAIVLLYLRKTGRQHLSGPVWWGLGVALAASIAAAILLERFAVNGEILEGALMLIAAFFVGTMILWMWRAAKNLKKEIESKVEEIASRSQETGGGLWVALFAFTFLMIFREGIETVIFLKAVRFSTDSLLSFFGGLFGIILAVAFGYFFVRGSLKIDLGRFFKITGIVLILFVVQLVIGGFHELAEGGLFAIGPTEMAVIGPFVKNNALFMMGILLIPFLMLMIPGQKKAAEPESASRADQRLKLAQEKRQRIQRTAAAVLSLLIVLFIGYDFVYGQNKKRLSEPEVVTAQDGEVRIPLSRLADHDFHRFVLSGTSVRFIVLKTDEETMATAFDACEICGSQGYIYESGSLICLNCDADINKSTLGRSGGCNPVPLMSKVEGDSLLVRVDDVMKEESKFMK